MANTAADHSALVSFPVAKRITLTTQNTWLAITVPRGANWMTITPKTNPGLWQSSAVNDAAVGADYGDISTAGLEIRLGPRKDPTRATVIGVSSAVGGTVFEIAYERHES